MRISIYLKTQENFHIELKIGQLFKCRIKINKIINKLIKDMKDHKKVEKESKILNKLLKEIDITNLTIVFKSNLFLDTFNIYQEVLYYICNNEIDEFLNNHFKTVSNVYYSVSYNTIGSSHINIEGIFDTKVYRLIKGLLKKE